MHENTAIDRSFQCYSVYENVEEKKEKFNNKQ